MDIIAALKYSNKIVWYKNDGKGNFTDEIILDPNAMGTFFVKTNDIDNDGDLDILFVSGSSHHASIIFNNGFGEFSDAIIISNISFFINSLLIADVDNDTFQDIIAFGGSYGEINWYKNDGLGSFGPPTSINEEQYIISSILATDFDSDGDKDVLMLGSVSVFSFINDGDGNFNQGNAIAFSSFPKLICATDLDIDKDIDIVLFSAYDKKLIWLENDSLGNFETHTIESGIENTNIYAGAAADLDLDCDFEIITASTSEGKIKWYSNLLDIPASENIELSSFNIFPNPMNAYCTINYNQNGNQYCHDHTYKANLYSISGQLIRKYKSIKGNNFTFNRRSLDAGIYILQIIDGIESKEFKLLIE